MADHITGASKKGVLESRAGFTLIEMAIVMVIVGIVLSIVATVMPAMISTGKIRAGRASLERYDYALEGYVLSSGNFPCPDTDGDGLEDRIDGATPPTDDTCDSYVGTLPYRTLGLSTGDDNWHNPVRYGVYEDLVRTASSNRCTGLSNIIKYYASNPVDTAKLHTTDSGGSINKAYLLVSGGASDRDGAGGFFDGLNGDGDEEFEISDKTVTDAYDDLVRSASFAWLSGRACTGGNAVASGGGVESSYTDGCTNGVDDDGDSYVDCLDQDCTGDTACTGTPETLTITTTSIPSGVVNMPYTTTFQASGGTPPYEWTLTDNGGFTGFFLHTYTGQFFGVLDQCPGTYAIVAAVEDSTAVSESGPLTDSKAFTLQVTNNMVVSRISGSGTDISWSSSSYQETFDVTGGHLGDINWSLDTGGATGFSVVSTGSEGCVIKKTGTTTAGTYTFTLTATDAGCGGNSSEITLSVTDTGTGVPGTIGSALDSFELDAVKGKEPCMVHVSGDVYAVAYSGDGDDGWLKTVIIDSTGGVTNTGYSLEFDASKGISPSLVQVSSSLYAVAYSGDGDDGWLKTVIIDSSGVITNTGHSLEFDAVKGSGPTLVKASGELYAVAYGGDGDDGWLKTVRIDSSGAITYTGHSLEFDEVRGSEPSLVKASGELYAVAYGGDGDDGWLKTVRIDSSGAITNTGYSLEFDATKGLEPSLIRVSSGLYAIAYRGDGDEGLLKTVTIDAAGIITDTGSSMVFDPLKGKTPSLIPVNGDLFAIAYSGDGDDGWLRTVLIDYAGNITATGASLEYDPVKGKTPSLIQVSGGLCAIAYSGDLDAGWLMTVEID